ncbi:hypothetical protein GGU10DRAFT_319342 [Lentinula aff. detonsa]|uniref:Uncharacterized protein n=1 Tax=Lentinula aff. detonsa TaxID=2804958 RepID=A0AA38KPL6_9AGAR|nr:hypothetical protein GGU10DRAFT_319342 [Lentinula aff. detonsa]
MVFPVPREIVDCILDNLYLDKATLLSCALVGKAWGLSAQRGIFQHITLELPIMQHEEFDELARAYNKRNEQLIGFFERKPYLASHVQTFELKQFGKLSRNGSRDKKEILYVSTTQVVERLCNVQSLLLSRGNWDSLSPQLREALKHLFSAPSLSRISISLFAISSFNEFASLLSQVSHLRMLKLHFLYCNNWDVPTSSQNHPPRSIQLDQLLYLHSVNTRAFAAWFQQDSCPLEVRNLRTLQIYSKLTDYEGTAPMLQSIGANLQRLELELQGPHGSQDSTLVHLGFTPNLSSITLANVQQTDIYSPIPWIVCLFEPNQNYDRLRQLTINLYTDHVNILETHRWDEWTTVDRLLAERRFASLETVKIELLGSPILASCDVKEVLTGKMPFLRSSGKLQVETPIEGEVNIDKIKAVISAF